MSTDGCKEHGRSQDDANDVKETHPGPRDRREGGDDVQLSHLRACFYSIGM